MSKKTDLVFEFDNSISNQVAYFDNKQIDKFTYNCYQSTDPAKLNTLTQKLKQNQQIQEIATTPLSLTLLCFVFEETADLPSNRLQLYREGLEILLKQWNVLHNISQDQVYKKLSLQQKEDLLSQIALKTFERGNYFFEQKEIVQYIADYIGNLPFSQTALEVLQLDSEAVLKSISAQHGLLVEGAKGTYSFSELALQEYFTAREIINSSEPQALEKSLQNLVERVTDSRWREVFLLAVGMLRNADYLLSIMKHQIDVVASNQEVQQFLIWSYQKSSSGKAPYKPLALRVLYLEFVLDLDFELARTLDNDLAYDLDFNPARVHTHCDLQNCQFSQQKQALKQYYDANKLLVDCLNNAHYTTRTVRKEIEDTLLIPTHFTYQDTAVLHNS